MPYFTTTQEKIKKILLWSQKYTKTDMIYLARGGFWISASRIFLILSAFGLSILYANLLSPETYGIYKYIISVAGIIGIFSLTGLDDAVAQTVASGSTKILKDAFITSLKWSFGIIIAGLSGAAYYYLLGNNLLAISLLIMAILLPLQQGANLSDPYFLGKRDFKTRAYRIIFQNLIYVIAITFTLLITKNPLYLIIVYFTINTTTSLIIYLLAKKQIDRPEKITKESIDFAKRLTANKFIGLTVKNIDKILVFHFLGPIQLAVYTFAVTPAQQIIDFLKPTLKDLLLPKLSQKSLIEIKLSAKNKIIKLLLVPLPIIIFYVLVAPLIYKTLFPAYQQAVIFSQILIFNLLSLPDVLFSQSLIAHVKKRQLHYLNFVNGLANLICLLILLPLYGIWGVILTKLITQIVTSLTLFILFYTLPKKDFIAIS